MPVPTTTSEPRVLLPRWRERDDEEGDVGARVLAADRPADPREVAAQDQLAVLLRQPEVRQGLLGVLDPGPLEPFALGERDQEPRDVRLRLRSGHGRSLTLAGAKLGLVRSLPGLVALERLRRVDV